MNTLTYLPADGSCAGKYLLPIIMKHILLFNKYIASVFYATPAYALEYFGNIAHFHK